MKSWFSFSDFYLVTNFETFLENTFLLKKNQIKGKKGMKKKNA